MKDVEKTNVERQNSSKRMRRRRRNFNIYAFVVLLLVLTAGITISYTFLFNISEIRVSGESDMYTAEEIVEASGIREGDNLLRLDPEKSEQAILDKLLFVERAEVDRDFPASLEIKVTRCEPAYNVSYDGGTLLVSKKGKILADNSFVTDGLPIIYGYDPSVMTAGKMLASTNNHKDDAFAALIASFDKDSENPVAYVDMNNEFSINVTYKNGTIFRMGNWSDAAYKLSLAENVMNEESVKGKKAYLMMVGSNQCSWRLNKEAVAVDTVTEPSGEKTTGADGKPVDSETNPEQEKMFEDYNNGNGSDSSAQQPVQQQDWNSYDGNDYGNDWNSYDGNDYGNDWNSYDGNDYGNDWNSYDGNGYGNDWNDYGGYDGYNDYAQSYDGGGIYY